MAQLANVEDGYHLWSERFDRELVDVFAIQDEISASIVETLKVKLAVGAKAPQATRTASQEAYDLYLRGMHNHFSLVTEEGFRKAIECFEQSLGLDPDYALSNAGVANAYVDLGIFGFLSAEQVGPKAEAARYRGSLVVLAKIEPWLDSLRSDPCFGEILKTMNLAD